MDLNLDGKVAIVTGGNAGIGKAIVAALAEAGAKVVIFATNSERGQATAEQINSSGVRGQVSFVQVDIANSEDLQAKIQNVVQEESKIDILVNNAGITRDQLLLKMTEEDWDSVLDVNLKACFIASKAVMRSMLKARKGKIVNIASVVGLIGNPGQANYAASKAGMIGFSKALAKEVATRNICINCVAPGYIETAMTENLNDKQKDAILGQIPMARMGQPEDIAKMVLFLVSDHAPYITGQVFNVDGGMVM